MIATALMTTMRKSVALDTNVLLYLHDSSSPAKRAIAKDLLSDNPFIPAQVVSEYLNVTRRLLQLSKTDLLLQASKLFADCTIIPVLPDTLALAAELVKNTIFKSLMQLSLLHQKRAIAVLYSEDMQHGLVVEKSLTIINPFL